MGTNATTGTSEFAGTHLARYEESNDIGKRPYDPRHNSTFVVTGEQVRMLVSCYTKSVRSLFLGTT